MYIDSHAHFDTFMEEGDTDAILERGADVGVEVCIAIGGSDAANERAVSLVSNYPGRIYATVGYDRDEAENARDMSAVNTLAQREGVVGIGETGLDYHYSADTAPSQRALFQHMLDAALAAEKAVVVHSREADEDTINMLTPYCEAWRGQGPPGVLHCFTGGVEFCEQLLNLGMMISFSGIITFKNAEELRAVARNVPKDRLLIETDAPYLAPVPFRGKRNEPGFVVHVAQAVADVKGLAVEEIARVTTDNARRLFQIPERS